MRLSALPVTPWFIGCLAFTIFWLPITNIAWGTEYFFSSSGNDLTGNGSVSNPWRSIGKMNTLDLDPGDQVFFRSGDTFTGSIYLDSIDSGTNASGHLVSPILISSYGGDARARIVTPSGNGLLSYNNGGIELSNLEFQGPGNSSLNTQGIYFYHDHFQGNVKQHHIRVDNVLVDGFGRWGIIMQSDTPVGSAMGGYRDVRVTNSELRNNGDGGLSMVATDWKELLHEDVYVGNVVAHNNSGFSGCSPHCGHGILFGQVDNGLIEHSVAHSNGVAAGKGNVGIWTWQSNEVTIQHNEAYGNRSPNGSDGGGFDIDGGVTNSIVQFNRSHDNDGAGYLLAQFGSAEPMARNVFRYNLSINDGKDSYGPITIWGNSNSDIASSAVFHNNTLVLDKNVVPNGRGVVTFFNDNHTSVDLFNNIFLAKNGAALIDGDTTASRTTFARNAYWTDGGPVFLEGTQYSNVATWAGTQNQEMIGGSYVGIQASPQFIDDLQYHLGGASPLIDAGIDYNSPPWPSWVTSMGNQDFYGVSLPQGGGYDIGAVESSLGDFNDDGTVDGLDFMHWLRGSSPHPLNPADLTLWLDHYSQTTASTSGVIVPEPGTVYYFSFLIGCTLANRPLSSLLLGSANRDLAEPGAYTK